MMRWLGEGSVVLGGSDASGPGVVGLYLATRTVCDGAGASPLTSLGPRRLSCHVTLNARIQHHASAVLRSALQLVTVCTREPCNLL